MRLGRWIGGPPSRCAKSSPPVIGLVSENAPARTAPQTPCTSGCPSDKRPGCDDGCCGCWPNRGAASTTKNTPIQKDRVLKGQSGTARFYMAGQFAGRETHRCRKRGGPGGDGTSPSQRRSRVPNLVAEAFLTAGVASWADRLRCLSLAPAASAALTLPCSVAARRGRAVGGYGLPFASQPPIQSNCCVDLQVQVRSRWRWCYIGRGFAGALSRPAVFVLGMLAVVTRQRDRCGV